MKDPYREEPYRQERRKLTYPSDLEQASFVEATFPFEAAAFPSEATCPFEVACPSPSDHLEGIQSPYLPSSVVEGNHLASDFHNHLALDCRTLLAHKRPASDCSLAVGIRFVVSIPFLADCIPFLADCTGFLSDGLGIGFRKSDIASVGDDLDSCERGLDSLRIAVELVQHSAA